MASEKVKIKDLPNKTSIADTDIFVESDEVNTYKITSDDIAKYISQAEHLTNKYVSIDSKGEKNGVAPLSENGKIPGKHITYGDVSNTAYEGSSGKILEKNLDNHLIDEDAHGYKTKLNAMIGSANGIAELDENGKVPSDQLPSFVDDVLEGHATGIIKDETNGTITATGFVLLGETSECVPESGKIYIDVETSIQYRWSGTIFVTTGSNIALGETSSTAYRGDRGKIAYNHSQSAHAPVNAQENVIENVQINSTTINPKNKTVNIPIPTKVSDLENDKNYKTTDTNTTYSLSRQGENIILVGSDGTASSVFGSSTEVGSNVSFSQDLASGTHIGTITINGESTELYAPSDTDTHYTTGLKVGATNISTANEEADGSIYLNVLDNNIVRDSHKITGSGATTVSSDGNGTIIISSSNVNDDRYYTEGEIDNKIHTLQENFQAGVDTCYNACVNRGATPSSSTPSAINDAIGSIYTNRYNSGYNTGKTDYNPTTATLSNGGALTVKNSAGTIRLSQTLSNSYDRGVSDADGRVNGDSFNYKSGYNNGVSDTKKGTAIAGNVLAGTTFTNQWEVNIAGTMPNRGGSQMACNTYLYYSPEGETYFVTWTPSGFYESMHNSTYCETLTRLIDVINNLGNRSGATLDASGVYESGGYTYFNVPANGYYDTNSKIRAVNTNLPDGSYNFAMVGSRGTLDTNNSKSNTISFPVTNGKRYLYIQTNDLVYTEVKKMYFSGVSTAKILRNTQVVASGYNNTEYFCLLRANSNTITVNITSTNNARTILRYMLLEVN